MVKMNSTLMLIAGNVMSFISATFLGISTFQKSKSDVLKFQILDGSFNVLSNLFLGGYSGCIVGIICLIRNLLVVNKKIGKVTGALIVSTILILGIKFNNRGLIGYLPIIAGIQYSLTVIIAENANTIKRALIVNLLLWCIYNLFIFSIPLFVTQLILLVITIANLAKDYRQTKLSQQ